MITYLYTEEYNGIFDNSNKLLAACVSMLEGCPIKWDDEEDGNECHRTVFHLAIYEMADKYDTSGLQEKAEEEIKLVVVREGAEWEKAAMVKIIDLNHQRGEDMKSVLKALSDTICKSWKSHIRLRHDGRGTLEALCRWPELCYHLPMNLQDWRPPGFFGGF